MHPGTDRPATGTAPAPDPGAVAGQRAALIRLAAALDPRDFATTLAPSHGRPCLAVTSRHAAIGDDITADHRAYYWSWHEHIAPISDPAAAARKITAVLRAIPGRG
jgi:hypothetical protein